MGSRPAPQKGTRRCARSQNGNDATQSGNLVALRFTGAAGGSHYVYDGERALHPGSVIVVALEGHWARLVASGNAEVLKA